MCRESEVTMNKNFNEDLDKKITHYFNSETKNISAPDNMFFKVRSEIIKKEKRGFLNMKLGFLKVKTIVAAAAICILTTATCGAVINNGFSWLGSSSHLTAVYKFPTEDKVEKTVGYLPKYVESFDGGFEFKSFNYSKDKLQNDLGETVSSGKGADFYYERKDSEKGQYLSLSAKKLNDDYSQLREEQPNGEVSEYSGIDIYYTNFKYKVVPPDYIPTEEEEKKVEDGSLQIGYGAREISEDNSQSVCWEQGGIQYCIINSNYDDVTKDEMIKMAKDIIDK